MKFELHSKGCAQAMLPLEALHNWEVLTNMAKTNEYMQAAVDELEKINLDKALRYEYSVSYTHLDVYKRQVPALCGRTHQS